MKCPGCGGSLKRTERVGVYTCRKCKGLIADHIYLGDSYGLVKPWMTTEQVPADRMRYFDLTCLGSAGITRRHGFYDTETGLVVQSG